MSAFKPAHKATLARLPDAGPSEESNQPAASESMSWESLLFDGRHTSTDEPRRLSGAIFPHPIPKPTK